MYRTVTFYGSAFQLILLTARPLRHYGVSHMKSHNPAPATLPAWHRHGLGFSPFARRYSGNRFYFLFLLLPRCFSSQAYHSRACSSSMRVAPFGNSGVIDYVHLGPDLSQLIASFFGCYCPGILRVLLISFFYQTE